MLSGSRMTQHRRGRENLGLGFCHSKLRFPISSSVLRTSKLLRRRQRLLAAIPTSLTAQNSHLVSCLHSNSPPEPSVLSDSCIRKEDDHDASSGKSPSIAGGIVALGKFDALHIGHRELVIQASKAGVPYLLSFVGMAEVLGWQPRPPIVANNDRKRVLSSWAPYCGYVVPTEFQLEFSSVRHLTPRQFVEKLSKDLGVHGVVAGKNYRFGYKAAGDASELVMLCNEYGLGSYVIDPVMDKNQGCEILCSDNLTERGQVSSTRVRHALSVGDMNHVSELLGRRHRLVLSIGSEHETVCNRHRISVPKLNLLNLAPRDGRYKNCSVIVGDKIPIPCEVTIDATSIHLELNDVGNLAPSARNGSLLSIEFGDSNV